MQLVKFLAHTGVCARRKAPALILAGKIKINNLIVTQVSYRLAPDDQVTYQGKVLKKERKVYILLNKPRGYITTLQDEKGRKTVRTLINHQGTERIYPVGRLDRNTTGLLLFTNHGDLAHKLAHPSTHVQKSYLVTLATPITLAHINNIKKGLHLSDGFIQPDSLQLANTTNTRLTILLHSGKNRIIRRIFDHLNYTVTRLDRVYYAGLTKKNLPIGQWRFLNKNEITHLQQLPLLSLRKKRGVHMMDSALPPIIHK